MEGAEYHDDAGSSSQSEKKEPSDAGDDDRRYRCGCGPFRPDWLQKFATSRFYAIVFGLLGVSQGAYRSYMVGTLSSVEKRFSISSRVSSIILIADDLSPLLASAVFLLFLRRTSMPNWISGGMLLSLVGALASYLPHAIFGTGTHLLEHASGPESSTVPPLQFCSEDGGSTSAFNRSGHCESHRSDWSAVGAVTLLFVGNFLNGLGGVACYVVGTTYMDDNVKKKNSALYFGGIYISRFIGPVVGLTLGSFCLSHYEDPWAGPDIGPGDPRWIGAWWMGYLVVGLCLLISALPVALFPRTLRRSSKAAGDDASLDNAGVFRSASPPSMKEEMKDAVRVLRRLSRNPIYVFRTLGNIAVYIALTGYYITFPKYTQHQFHQTASRASLFTGPVVIVSNMVGTLAGAVFVHRWQPRPRVIAWHNVLVTILAVLGVSALMAIDCGTLRYPVGAHDETRSSTVENACTRECSCSPDVHRPVCDESTGMQYFSPCFAGCTSQLGNESEFKDCHCLVNGEDKKEFHSGVVMSGKCEQDCSSALTAFSVVVFVIQVCYSTTLVGSTLLVIRSLNVKDKSAALSILSAIMNMFAFIPYPLIYGALVDSSCLVWEDRCGDRGACWLYDLSKFRFLLHGVTAALLVVGCFLQGVVVRYSDRVTDFYEDTATCDAGSPRSAAPLLPVRKAICGKAAA